jgi:hypothetical protein
VVVSDETEIIFHHLIGIVLKTLNIEILPHQITFLKRRMMEQLGNDAFYPGAIED